MFRCRACCGEAASKEFVAREMMFGTRKQFQYVECAGCGSVQIAEIPPLDLLAEHYPPNYYSFSLSSPERRTWLRRVLGVVRARHLFHRPNLLGLVLTKVRPL